MSRRRVIGAVLAGAVALTACASSPPSRGEVVSDMTDEWVPARFERLADDAGALSEAARDWCVSGDVENVRDRLSVVHSGWVALSPFWFGPIAERRSRSIIDPEARDADVRELLDADQPLDATAVRELYGADQRGVGAVALLLDISDVVPTDRQCEYTSAVVDLLAEETELLAADWAVAGPEMGSDEGVANETLEGIVNESLFAIDALIRQSNEADSDVDAATVEGVRLAMLGGELAGAPGESAGLARLLDDAVVEQLTSEFDAARSLSNGGLVELRRTITTNVVSTLGLSVQFSDADGDG